MPDVAAGSVNVVPVGEPISENGPSGESARFTRYPAALLDEAQASCTLVPRSVATSPVGTDGSGAIGVANTCAELADSAVPLWAETT